MQLDMQAIYYIVAAIVSIIGLVAGLIIKIAKSDGAKKRAQTALEIADETMKVLEIVKKCMIDTEDKKNFTAVEKHDYCKAMVIDKCLTQQIDYTQVDLDQAIADYMEIADNINSTHKALKKENVEE